ncbi:DUF7524 family protein [Halorarum halobium]|uniref:DUF7524 family protein n=1 Tax=Halorarum halobium TaxID=3075121 RepID=UPI0028A91666|nr:hypothetical protein [Halobaculum sp. XH14]
MSSEPLRVVLNRDRLNGVDAPASFTSSGSFTLALDNRGKAVHVHVRFRDRLADLTSVSAANHFVDEGETRHVHVDAADVPEPVGGGLEVITGHGADGADVDLALEPRERTAGVDVDDALSQPPKRGTDQGSGQSGGPDQGRRLGDGSRWPGDESVSLLLAAFALTALLAGVIAVLTLNSFAVAMGLLAVVLSVCGAAYVLRT